MFTQSWEFVTKILWFTWGDGGGYISCCCSFHVLHNQFAESLNQISTTLSPFSPNQFWLMGQVLRTQVVCSLLEFLTKMNSFHIEMHYHILSMKLVLQSILLLLHVCLKDSQTSAQHDHIFHNIEKELKCSMNHGSTHTLDQHTPPLRHLLFSGFFFST